MSVADILGYLTGEKTISAYVRQSWAEYLTKIEIQLKKSGRSFIFLAVPEKHTILADKLPETVRLRRPTPLDVLSQNFSNIPGYVNIQDLFNEELEQERLYLRGDSHWSPNGAMAVYCAMCRHLHIPEIRPIGPLEFDPDSPADLYHVPGGQYYSRTKITPSKGERWFCSDAEARAAGWRRSKR